MKIESITRAHEIKDELSIFRQNIKGIKDWIKENPKGSGFLMHEYSDGSGALEMKHMFQNGDFNEGVYKEMADSILKILEKHYDVLIAEIEEL